MRRDTHESNIWAKWVVEGKKIWGLERSEMNRLL